MALKDVLQLDVNVTVKPYLRVETAADDVIITLLTEAAIQRAEDLLNREFPLDAPELHTIRLALLQTIAFWYENRGDTQAMPAFAVNELLKYRFEPGF